ncbi:hypothetical protein OG800_48620 [Streptomyces sp. NBC_00445]|uniref:hypothetical protein n=1 Tax=Streptomyces sp. NBC_00445 TaxID=2975745 RepID=UPI002E1EA7B7
MPKFLVLIHDDESKPASASPQELGATGAAHAHGAFAEASGPALRDGGRIGPSSESLSIVHGIPSNFGGGIEVRPLIG